MKRKITLIIIASILIGIGINGFILPIHLINGGLMGVSLILHYLLGYKVAFIFACLNAPIYLVASRYNLTYFINGVLGTIGSSIMISLLFPVSLMIHLPTAISVIIGGTLIGLGVGTMLRYHISPGGIDLLALIISKALSLNVGIVLLLLDLLIILTGVLVLRDERLLISVLVVLIAGTTAAIITSIKSVKIYI